MKFAATHEVPAWLAAATTTVLAFAAHAGMAAALAAPKVQLTELMQQLAQRRHGEATFVERQYLAVLDRPLESSGELLYDAPDRLEKRTLLPKPESLLLQGGTVTITRSRRHYQIALRDYPQVTVFVESIRATLAGDLQALEKDYEVHFDAPSSDWTLVLVPRDAKLSAVIRRIRIGGRDAAIQTIEIMRADGDRSVMTIGPVPDG